MLRELKINGLPSTPDSLTWSSAGDLCASAGPKVHLYIPNQNSTFQRSSDPSLRPWFVSMLDVNTFKTEEWPLFPQRPYVDFSIGEEESESHVISCSWSPPGLAQHDRCLLGVLTANGLFSLWDTNGDPGFATSWRRSLVVNNQLQAFLSSQVAEVPPRKLRIRAASWAKELIVPNTEAINKRIHVLGLLNDDGEVILIQVQRSKADQDQEGLHNVHILYILKTQRELRLFPDGMLDELQWSSWNHEDMSYSTRLFCSTEGCTWEILVSIKSSGLSGIDAACAVLGSNQRQIAEWNVSKSQLAMLNNKYLDHVQIVLKKAWELEKGEGSPCVVRCFGLATYGEYQALHITFHPRNSIEYYIQAQETSFVIFSHSSLKDSLVNADKLEFDWESVASTSNDLAIPWSFILAEAPSIHLDDSLSDDYHNLCLRMLRLYLVTAFLNGWELKGAEQLSAKLVRNQKQMEEETLQTIEEDREEYSSHEALQHIESVMNSFFDLPAGLENCSICNEYLLWHGEGGARCQNGHEFDRCSLTLLAIQEPGISKFCNSCNREYLDEKKLVFHDDNPNESLFRRFLLELFEKFSKCVYCGGTVQSFT